MGSEIGGSWEDHGGVFFQIRSKKCFKTRRNSLYGGETSIYSLIQQEVFGFCDTFFRILEHCDMSSNFSMCCVYLAFQVLKSTETNILGASKELKEIVIESGHMAESLFERVNTGYDELKVYCINMYIQ